MRCCCKKKPQGAFSNYRRQGSHNEHPSQNSLKVLAAQTLKIASINGLGDAEKLETELEDEIRWEENRRPPSEIIGRFRRRCEEILHTKPVLLCIVVLNIIDCLLVLGELTLDFHHISYLYYVTDKHNNDFLKNLKNVSDYTELRQLTNAKKDNLTVLFDMLLRGFVFWNASSYTQQTLAQDCQAFLPASNHSSGNNSSNTLTALVRYGQRTPRVMGAMDSEGFDAENIGHSLHYASISILSFLLAETLLKIFCVGKRFLRKRMEVFDAVVVFISFTLDLAFIKGITGMELDNYVIILSCLLPWRVLRILNSLIVAVMDQHRFHLKLLYKQKRRVTRQHHEASEQVKILEKNVEILKNLCSSKGMRDWEINQALGQKLSPNGPGGGLKALSKLVFRAAESFAPLSSPTLDKPGPGLHPERASAPSLALSFMRWNGDAEHGSSNGHAHALKEEEVHVEDETETKAVCNNHVRGSEVKDTTADVEAEDVRMEEKETEETAEVNDNEMKGENEAVVSEVKGEDETDVSEVKDPNESNESSETTEVAEMSEPKRPEEDAPVTEEPQTQTNDNEIPEPKLKFYLSQGSVDSGTSPSDDEVECDVTRL